MGKTLAKPRKDPDVLLGLTDKEYRFVHEYPVHYDGTRAVIAAKYSPKVAAVTACKMLKKTHIKNAIRYLERKYIEQCTLTALEVRERVALILRFQPARYFDVGGDGGWFTDREGLDRLPDWVHELVVEIQRKMVKNGDEELFWVKFMSKDKALELACRYTLTEKHQSAMKGIIDLSGLYEDGKDSPDKIEEELNEEE